MNIPGIIYKGDIVRSMETDDSLETITMFKDREYFEEIETYKNYVKKCEKAVRTSQDYSNFIKYIKEILGINFCQVSSQIVSGDATIEMHHGPIFTLFDYCSIILNDYLQKGKRISTFRIANTVIQEHYDMRVQVVMLAVTNHEAVTNRDIFLNIRQGIGNVNEFIEKYANAFDDEQKYKVWNYIEYSKHNDTYDTGILDTKNISKMLRD